MKITKLELENFQAHKKLLIRTDQGITTIVGPSDRGKSSVIRALGWVALNNFAGDEFIREGEKATRVSVKVLTEEGPALIVRNRNKSGTLNTYELGEQEYKAFGTGVPADIAQSLCISPLNFQSQHDAPFWFAETAGEVSRRLNAVIDLSVIDSSLGYIAGRVRHAAEREQLCKERLEELNKELEQAKQQEDRIEEYEDIATLHHKAKTVQVRATELEDLVTDVETNPYKARRQQSSDGKELLVLLESAIAIEAHASDLRKQIRDLKTLKVEATTPPDFSPVRVARSEYEQLEKERRQLGDCIALVEHKLFEATDTEQKMERAEKQFHQKTKGTACPLCGNIIR